MNELDLLKTVKLFGQLTADELVILADHADFVEFADGEEVFATNSTDRELFVIERGEVANTWKHERWDSMRLLTPNRQTRLHGYRYDGDDPDGASCSSRCRRFCHRR